MDDLLQWLGEQLDEDERIAHAAAKRVSAPPNDGNLWRRDWDTIHTAPSNPPGPRVKVADCGHGAGDLTAHIAEHDPARVLREIDAKRQLIRELLEYEAQFDSDRGCGHDADYFASGLHSGHMPKEILGLRLIASGYSHRPGFREEWRP